VDRSTLFEFCSLNYLSKEAVRQQLQLLAQDAVGATAVQVKKAS
jgi:hypothetical protein